MIHDTLCDLPCKVCNAPCYYMDIACDGNHYCGNKIDHWFVYIVLCSDKTLYTGTSNDVNNRIANHNAGRGAKYTKTRTPVSLFNIFGPFTKSEAAKLEYKIKQLSREEKLVFKNEQA